MNWLPHPPKPANYQPANNLWPLLMLLFLLATALSSLRQTSPTYDEHEYLARGYLYLNTGDTRLKLRHPVLLDTLAAMPLLLLSGIDLPVDHPSLEAGDFHRYAAVFFWERNEVLADQMIFLARLPTIFLLLLLAAAIYRWTRLRFGQTAALVALALTTFDPNLLAHGRLVTPDVGQTTFIFLSLFAWWLFLRRPSWQQGLWAGFFLGLAQTAGFPALLLYPVLFLVTAAYGWKLPSSPQPGMRSQTLPRLFTALLGISLLSLLVIWAVYRFSWGKVEPLGWWLPAPYHWAEFLDLWQRLGRQDLAYLNGEVYRGGRFTFFLVALFIKTPIPTLLLAGAGIWQMWRRTPLINIAFWLLPILYYANALISSLNIGYRHILPILPFMFVWAGAAAARAATRRQQLIVVGLCGWLFITSGRIYPHYLAYFNELVGGPSHGRFHLAVSDLDWGQDLGNLAHYLQREGSEQVYLSYFGTAPPEHYGIRYEPLPAWPPRGNETQHPYHPQYPLPGRYALSVANLVGARFESAPDTFAWFRGQEAQAQIGYSILVYDVPRLLQPTAPPVNLALADIALRELPDSIFEEYFHTNDVRLRWFDSQGALILPAGTASWLISADPLLSPRPAQGGITPLLPVVSITAANGERVTLYKVGETAVIKDYFAAVAANPFYLPGQTHPVNEPVSLGGTLTFLGYQWVSGEITPGSTVQLLTYWQAEAATRQTLAFFVHYRAVDGRILAQHDGMDVVSHSWYSGDLLLQLHELTLPAAAPATDDWLALGVYDVDTLVRLPVIIGGQTPGDHLLLPKPN